MAERNSSSNIAAASTSATSKSTFEEVEALHRRCGVYTKPEVVRRILDAVGWRIDVNLSRSRLLEPAAGDGAFLVEAARRLVASCIRHGIPLRSSSLSDRIRAFELHPREARRARSRVTDVLLGMGIRYATAKACGRSWVVNADFLLAKLSAESFTHAVGNPPYIRWSKIPPNLKILYARHLPSDLIRGDLFVPFLDRSLQLLRSNGRCGFLCSDRWRFMAFAEKFRRKWLPRLEIASEDALLAADAFVEDVDSYPTILIASKKKAKQQKAPVVAIRRGKTLPELGYVVKVGPALGHTRAFVLGPDENDVEAELLQPWIDAAEITEGAILWRGRRIVTMYGQDGSLIDPELYPLLSCRLKRFRLKLTQRSIVRHGEPWYRPIDHVAANQWSRPKLLVPELAKVPRIAIDRSGAIPSHGVYAIFAPEDDVETLYQKLRDGKLATALEGIAPKVKGGYTRCYRRFLDMIEIDGEANA